MGLKYVGVPPSEPEEIALLGRIDRSVTVVTGFEERPITTGRVTWVGGTTAPSMREPGDIWLAKGSEEPPEITTTTLNSLTVGSPFSQTISATNNPALWLVSAGTLPAGLTLNEETGVISGTPTTSGSYTFSLTASNPFGSDVQEFTGSVATSGVAPTIITETLNALTKDAIFSQILSASGSTPRTWGIISGSIAGIGINSSTGALSGTPTADGPYSITVEVTNEFGSDTQVYVGVISPAGGSGEGEDFSFFAYGAPASVQGFTDAGSGVWMGHSYYAKSGYDVSGSELVAVKLHVPASLNGYSGGRLSIGRNFEGVGPVIGYSNAQMESYVIVNLPTLVTGVMEIELPAPIELFNNAGFVIGYELDGRYIYSYGINAGTPTSHGGGDRPGFFIPGLDGIGNTRSFYDGSISNSAWYGIEPIIRMNPGLPQPTGPWTRRTPFRAPGISGQTTQTVNFKSATLGNRLLMAVTSSSTVSTPSGWTLVQSAIGGTGLYLFSKIATAGESSVDITTSVANFTVLGMVYEFPSTMTIAASAKIDSQGVSGTQLNPALSGLTGSNYVFLLRSTGASGGLAGVSWDSGIETEALLTTYGPESRAVQPGDGTGLVIGYEGSVTSSTYVKGGDTIRQQSIETYQSITFAVKL